MRKVLEMASSSLKNTGFIPRFIEECHAIRAIFSAPAGNLVDFWVVLVQLDAWEDDHFTSLDLWGWSEREQTGKMVLSESCFTSCV